MTRRATPTPQELVHWAAVASPAAARGTYRWHARDADTAAGIGWYGWAGDVPAPLHVPPDVDVAFWYEADARWRIEVDGALLAVADGRQAVAGTGDHAHVGSRLLAPGGPARLLHPEARLTPSGEVSADERLGRPCWRWRSPVATWWIDHDTGIALAYEAPDLRAELLELALDAVGADFSVPDDRVASAIPIVEPPEDPWPVEREPAQAPAFTVPWWPQGTSCWPDRGDPSVPEVLVVLVTQQEPRFWLGVAPLPRRAPVKPRRQVHRWTGDGWSFSLSWHGELAPEDLARVVASVPRRWEP